MKILCQYPTRGRPELFLTTLKKYKDTAKNNKNITYHVVIDKDDTSMKNIKNYNITNGVLFIMTESKTKIEAINKVPDIVNWDILLLVSDDMIPQVNGWDNIIREDMQKYYPDLDGVLWYNDGYAGRRLNTLACMGRKYYERFGYIYHPAYKSLYADNEFMEVANNLKKQTYIDSVIIKHEHPANTGKPYDERYRITESFYSEDKAMYEKRKQAGFK
jgi:hypothetical protein